MKSWRAVSKDYRSVCLGLAMLAVMALFLFPQRMQKSPVHEYVFIVDITRSMNAADYSQEGQNLSRLDYVKQSLRTLLARLPCETKVGLGLFTERRSTLLFEPLAICAAHAEIDAAITHIDWRMAWAADSNIAKGLFSTLEMLQKQDVTLVFLTDGHEAPPVNPAYQPDFSSLQGRTKGVIVGVGGLQAAPIPKFDEQGRQTGFYNQDDVPHRSTFGQSNLDPSQIEGYNARNAPFGNQVVSGNEHLSALHESYLQQLAQSAGLRYVRLDNADDLLNALQAPALAVEKTIAVDIRWKMAVFALIQLTLVYWPGFAVVSVLRNQMRRL